MKHTIRAAVWLAGGVTALIPTSASAASREGRFDHATALTALASKAGGDSFRTLMQVGDAGSIAGVAYDAGTGTYTATYTANGGYCSLSGFCGWFPYAVQVPAGLACRPHIDGSGDLTYVGSAQSTPFPAQVSTEVFYPGTGSGTICLYVSHGSGVEFLVAQTPFGGAAATPTPTST